MAKKKKKGPREIIDVGGESAAAAAAARDVLRILLLPTIYGKKSPTITTTAESSSAAVSMSLTPAAQVCLGASDATHLTATSGESVWLVVVENNAKNDQVRIVAAAHLELHVVQGQGDDRNDASRVRTPTPRAKASTPPRLAAGAIQITSRSVLDSITRRIKRSENGSDESTGLTDSPETPLAASTEPSVPTTPSSGTPSRFSFRHSLEAQSPPDSRTKAIRTTATATSTAPPIECWLIANRCGWDQRMASAQLCVPCRSLTVEFVQSNQQPLSHHVSLRTMERIVLTYTVGHSICLGQTWTISIQGRPVNVRAVQAVASVGINADTADNTTALLTNELEQLQLDETPELDVSRPLKAKDETCSNGNDERSLNNLFAKGTLVVDDDARLYQISYDTAIHVVAPCVAPNNHSSLSPRGKGTREEPRQRKYVAGLDATMDQVRSLLLTPLIYPELFHATRIPAPRGVLLYGPSGVGKSCLARQIGAELESLLALGAESSSPSTPSTTTNVSRTLSKRVVVQYIPCSTLQSQAVVVGQAEQALTALFKPSQEYHKLIILDDVQLICAKRGGANQSANGDRLAATLLALVDGIRNTTSGVSSPGTVVLLAITPNPSALDPALRRPGRLDAEVEVPIPDDAPVRAEILKFQLDALGATLVVPNKGEPAATESDWLEVAKLAKGFNGADCMLAVKEAIRSAILEQRNTSVDPAEKDQYRLQLLSRHLQAAIRAIKPSAIKSITVEIPQVLWSSIGGMDSVKTELREAIELPVTHSAYFDQLGVPPPRGILLYGPPGCSKTLMARALATESSMNFLAVKGPELLSKWLGESERALSSLFRRARMASPAIIFFDEIDAIASKRGSGDSSSGGGRLLSQLLTELDGVIVHGGGGSAGRKPVRVVVVGATNRPDLLDPALTRPGRIDRMIYVGVPDSASRAQILQLSLRDKLCDKDIDIAHLARDEISHGFSGAEMVAICRDAALLALEESDTVDEMDNLVERIPQITMKHLLSAFQSMQRQITPDMIRFYDSYRQKEHH